ncbi:hypothetical protein [Xanthobacter aminoxidans]|uniref:Uncharacterized protein n=1 Tax=Xanthobacter aminoxidans TaxID=186280 RepID=A0ABW6ZNA0_9HYPH
MIRIGEVHAPVFDAAAPWHDTRRDMEPLGLGDGLPLAVPTRDAIEAMLDGRDPDRSLGPVPPLFGEASMGNLAYLSVLAGCRPGVLAILTAAVDAMLAPAFNLLGIATTTGSATVAVIVSGPQVTRLRFNPGGNGLGPGCAANATLGRALQFVLGALGGAQPGVDMATIGQPGKYTFVCAENQEAILAALADRQGGADGADVVTVVGATGTIEVLPRVYRSASDILFPPVDVLHAAKCAGRTSGETRPDDVDILLLPPELASRLRELGLTRVEVETILAERAGYAIIPVVTGGAGIKMCAIPSWPGGSRPQTVPVAPRRAAPALP